MDYLSPPNYGIATTTNSKPALVLLSFHKPEIRSAGREGDKAPQATSVRALKTGRLRILIAADLYSEAGAEAIRIRSLNFLNLLATDMQGEGKVDGFAGSEGGFFERETARDLSKEEARWQERDSEP